MLARNVSSLQVSVFERAGKITAEESNSMRIQGKIEELQSLTNSFEIQVRK